MVVLKAVWRCYRLGEYIPNAAKKLQRPKDWLEDCAGPPTLPGRLRRDQSSNTMYVL
jgi:hypothetical protein